jgi:hypothetical protein
MTEDGAIRFAYCALPVHPGEILREEFLVSLKLTPYAVIQGQTMGLPMLWNGRRRPVAGSLLSAPPSR